MEVRWTRARAEHIATRSSRYPDSIDIDVEWANEAAADPSAVISDPDPRSVTGAIRIVGYSPAAGLVITVIAARIDSELWGVTAWKTTGAERRTYQEAHDGDAIRD
ncbi:MAG: hypothetical protein DLM60_15700 [Pseudonocardiales bacterium]|nr:hypothetical protein [Actinomycetota bacterium]PZS16241.1 MAG: hypothetical protein DLM60_15700 [Pseudonocardiales bacterium]